MSNKLKRESKKKAEEAQKEQEDLHKRMMTQSYREDAELKITGREFATLIFQTKRAVDNRTIDVTGANQAVVGYGIHPNDQDVVDAYRFIMGIHRRFVEEGLSEDISVLREEMMKQAPDLPPGAIQMEGNNGETVTIEPEANLADGQIDPDTGEVGVAEEVADTDPVSA